MNIKFTARHFEASPRLQNYSKDSIQKLQKFYDGIIDVDIILQPSDSEDDPQSADVTVSVPGDLLKATETAPSYEQALNKVIDNLRRQLIKYKEKRFAKN